MKLKMAFAALLMCVSYFTGVHSHDHSLTLSADNISQFRSVKHIEFAAQGGAAGQVENGWFALSPDGSFIAAMNREGDIVIWDDSGVVIDRFALPGTDGLPATVLDIAFRQNQPAVVSAHAEGGAYFVAYRDVVAHTLDYFRFDTPDVPLRIWDSGDTWLEVSPADYLRGRYVQRITPPLSVSPRLNAVLSASDVYELPSGPENDTEAFLRIGRIEAPYALTITQDFLIKRWNMETGEVSATAQLDAMPGAGQLTPDGRYFAWRDGDSKALHLLDFDSGIDKQIDALNGRYIPFLLLNSSASVIIGVNIGLQPIVVAWDTLTGRQIDLGEYRFCNRQPDMVRLSLDSQMMIIGCDTGFDIWRVQ